MVDIFRIYSMSKPITSVAVMNFRDQFKRMVYRAIVEEGAKPHRKFAATL